MSIIKRNNINVYGEGKKAMLFAHGFGCDQNMWRFVAPAFEKDHKVVLFDHVGAGKSDISAYNAIKYNSLHGYAEDVIEICLELGLKDVVFVGHSVSAMIGILAANKKPFLFSELVLIGPSPCYINDGDYVGGFSREDIESLLGSLDSNYLGWSALMAPVIMANSERPELGEELKNSFCSTNPEIAKHFAKVTFFSDNREDLGNVTVPSLIMQCSSDVIAPLEVGYYLSKKLKNSTLVVMDATGHCPNLSAPEETTSIMKTFLYKEKIGSLSRS